MVPRPSICLYPILLHSKWSPPFAHRCRRSASSPYRSDEITPRVNRTAASASSSGADSCASLPASSPGAAILAPVEIVLHLTVTRGDLLLAKLISLLLLLQ